MTRHIERVRRRPVRGLYRHQRRVGGDHRPAVCACKVSQKVLLTVMQKEQHSVTAVDPSDYQLMAAMGLNCPDTADCDPAHAGFFLAGARRGCRYRYYLEHEEQYGYTCTIQLHPISERGMRRRTTAYREQGDRPAHIYTPYSAEHRRTGRWQRYRRFLLQLYNRKLRAYLHQLVGSPRS